MDMLVLDKNPTKKFKEPSKELSLMPNLTLFPSEEDIGEIKLVKPIPSPLKLPEEEDLLESDLSPVPEDQELSDHLLPKKFFNSLESKIVILLPKE
jgi:hypothetical protein